MSQEMSEHNVQSDSSREAMKVTLLGDGWTSSTGGLATLNRELAIQLSQHPQVDVCLLVPDGRCSDEDKSEAKKHGITVVSAKERPGYDEPLDWLGAPPEGHKMDVVVGHGANLGRQVQFIKDSARFENCKWVQVVHTAPEDLSKYKDYSDRISKGEKKHEVEVKLCKLADLIVPIGPRLGEVYSSCLQRYKRDTCIFPVIPGLFDREFGGLEQCPNENAEFKVLLCGRADEEDFELKGYNLAAKAFTDHRLQGKRYSLLFVGAPEGKQEVVRDKLVQCGIAEEQLTVKTFVKEREKMKDLLCEVDLAIMPSKAEGFGLVSLEALSAGLPILVNSKSGFARALDELLFGDLFIVNSDEPAKWAEAIEGVHKRHRKRLKEITLLRTSYDKQYSWKEQCGKLVEKLRTMVYGSSNGSVRLPEGELLAQQQSAAVASLEGFCGQQCFSDGEKKGCGANQESESLGVQCQQGSTKQNNSGSTFDLAREKPPLPQQSNAGSASFKGLCGQQSFYVAVKKGSGGNEKGELGVQSLQGSRKRKPSGSTFDLDNLRIVRIKTNPEDLNGDQRREFEEFLLYRWQRFKTNNDISSAEGMVEFIEYLTEAHGLFLKEIKKGCLEITVVCPNLDSLESLWNDYRCGQLNEILQKYLVTDEIKEKLNLENVTLQTTIPEEDYIKAKTSFVKMSDIDQFNIPRNVHPAMNSGNNESLDDLLPRVVKDKLQQRQVKDKCLTFLTEVQIPSGWDDKSYKLNQSLPTYKYRLEILRNFVLKKEAEGFSITGRDESSKQFFEELKQFSADTEIDYWFDHESAQSHRGKVGVDLFEQNVKLKGLVVWKSEKELKASVLIQGEACSKDGRFAGPNFSPCELVVSLQDEAQPGTEFNLKVAVGDIVEVAKCVRKEGEALEPEIIMCYSLSGTEIESYLNILSSYVKDDSSTAAVTEITRCRAAWDYILELSEEEFTTNMSVQILEIINKICSSARMSHTVSEIMQSFQQSKFFGVILVDFIDKMTEESCDFRLIQKILEHVVSVIPSSGLQVLPMAKALALNLVKVSSDSAVSAVEFLTRLSTNIASELMPGAHKDVEVLPWKELPLIPVTEEIKKPRLKTDDLPVINENGGYKSEDDYLNTYFRLLREECFYNLRKGISDFVINGQKSDSKDMMMYRISLRGACTQHEESPTAMLFSLEYELLMETQDSSESENTGWLLYGNLLCISLDGYFQEPVWAVIEKHISEEDQRIIRITLCEKDNTISEPEFITKMQEINNRDEKAFMAESQTFYLSHAPAMEVLQHRDHVPFKEFLVDASTDPGYLQPAEYISQIESPPDWGIIFERDSLPECRGKDESYAEYSLLNDFDALRLNAKYKRILDDSQMNAVELALKNKLALIQGPPGTGKSYVGVALVNLLLSMKVPENHGPILVVTYKNHALDNFLTDCLKKVSSPDLKIVRVGQVDENADDRLQRCLLRKVGGQWPERLFKQKRKLLGQIWSLQRRVTEAFEKLRSSSNFTTDMFIEEARKDQVKCLLTENQTEKIAEAEVDRLINGQWRTRGKLKELVEKALGVWLPSQEDFNSFARSVVKEKGTVAENRDPGKDKKKKSKDDQDQFENPNDFKDPSVEQRERLFAIDEDIADEEDKEIANKSKSPASRDSSYKSGCLRSLVCIDESKVKDFRHLLDVGNVWELSKREKVRLVYVLQGNFYTKATSDYLAVSKEYAQLHHQLKELRNQHDIEVMKRCHIIGMTVTGATLRANLLADIKPSVMIVEEAAEILEGQLVAVIPPSVQHLIMIGDHKQLRPMVHFTRLKKDCHLDLSMFERLVNCNLPFMQLEYQCRMRDEFVDLLRDLKIYKELKTNDKLVRWNDPPPYVDKTMYFWEHTKWENESKGSPSKRNTREAIEITKVAKRFCLEGNVPPLKITVLCSYRGQVQEIKSHFSSADVKALEDIKVTTIDSYQGQENDIILLSLVRSNEKGTIGYLSSINRLCVAISRARCGLYLFGNQSQLASASKKGWKVVRDSMRKKGCVGTRFPFSSTEHSTSRQHSETRFDRRSLVRDTESTIAGTNITVITATQAYVNIGDSSVNTINTSPATVPRSYASLSTRLYLPSPPSGKQPVHDPKSPLPGYRPPTVGGSPTEEVGAPTKEPREPIQEFGKPRKEVGSPTLEVDPTLKEAKHPIQEVGKPKQEARSPTAEVGSPTEGATFRQSGRQSRSKRSANPKQK